MSQQPDDDEAVPAPAGETWTFQTEELPVPGPERVRDSGPFVVPGEVELMTLRPPLLDRARELVNRDVLVIAGGSNLDGRLVDVDEEGLLLTVEDSNYRFYVDLQSVAVLAVSRR